MWLDLNTCSVDLAQGQIVRGSETLSLTPLELGVLRTLNQRPLRIWSRQDLLDQVWQGGSLRALESTVGRLRRKLEADPRRPKHLLKRYGQGYILALGAPARGPTLAWIRRLSERGAVRLWGPPGSDLQRVARAAGLPPPKEAPELGCPRVVLLQPLDDEAAQALLLDHLPRPIQDLAPLVALGQGLPGPLRELAERAGLRGPMELAEDLKRAPHALLPRSAAEASAFWAQLPQALQQACGPLAQCARPWVPLGQALRLLDQERLERLHRAGALLRAEGQETQVALPVLLRHMARTQAGDQRHADWVLSHCKGLKARLDGGESLEDDLVAWLPEVEVAIGHFLSTAPDAAVALLETVNTAARRRGLEQDLERLQGMVLPQCDALSAQSASSFFQMRSERLRMAGDLQAAVDFAQRALEQARRCGVEEELGLALAQVAILQHHLGAYEQASLAYAEALGVPLAPRHRLTLLSNLASVQRALGEDTAAERTLSLLLAQPDLAPAKRFGVHRALAFLYINRGEHTQAEAAHRSMAPLLKGRSGSLDAAILGVQRGLLALDQGAPLRALQELQAALQVAESIGEHRTQAMALDYAGAACVLLERLDQAQAFLARSVVAYGRAGRPEVGAWPLCWRVLSARAADPETAGALAEAQALDSGALLPVAEQHLALLQAQGARAVREARQATRRRLDGLSAEVEAGAEMRVAVRWLRAHWALF